MENNLALKAFRISSSLYKPMQEAVNDLKPKTSNNPLFVEYYEWNIDEDTDEIIIIMEPVTNMTLKEYVECYGFLDEKTILWILQQILAGLEILFNISYFHGNLSINNIFIDQNTMAIKLTDYGLYNCIYTENQLDTFEGSKMDIFCLGIIILKVLGKLRLNMPLDMGKLQYKVSILKSLYQTDSLSSQFKFFLDIWFDSKVDLHRLQIHPFIFNQRDISSPTQRSSGAQNSLEKTEVQRKESKLFSVKESGEEKSEFTFGSGNNRNSFSSKSSESNWFPPEVKKFLTKGSGLESSSNGVLTNSERNSLDYLWHFSYNGKR